MSETLPDLRPRLEFAVAAARKASVFILNHYQTAGLVVDRKRDSSPVTEADRGAEVLIRGEISRDFPDDGVLGEEFGDTPGTSGFRWILDPVDGTKSFIHGVPLFGTLIGLEYQGTCVLGVCRFPALNEVVYGARGLGAWWQIGDADPQPARVSEVSQLDHALFCVTTITRWERVGRSNMFQKLMGATGLTRGWGDCYGHALVATGRAELIVDPVMNVWDAAALVPILEEAGGHFVDFRGTSTANSGHGISVNAALKDEVLRIVQESL